MCQFKPVRRPEHMVVSAKPITPQANPTALRLLQSNLSGASSESVNRVQQLTDMRSSWASSCADDAGMSELRPRSTVPLPIKATPPPSPEKSCMPNAGKLQEPDSSSQVIAAQKQEIAQLQSQINELRLMVSQLISVMGESKAAGALIRVQEEISTNITSGVVIDQTDSSVAADIIDGIPRSAATERTKEGTPSADKSSYKEEGTGCHNQESVPIGSDLPCVESVDEGFVDDVDEAMGALQVQPVHSEEPSIMQKMSVKEFEDADSSIALMEPPSAIDLYADHRRPVFQPGKPLGHRLPMRRLSLDKRTRGNMGK